MLGEAALTDADALRYLAAYEHAIDAIGVAAAGKGIYEGPGISIKLSALHPRYSRAQLARTQTELYPRLLKLALMARGHDIGLNIDAEEADRLEISLDLLERLCAEPALLGWNGIGFVVQAYQKRCPHVLDHLIDLARRSRRRLMLRLVKGAYWDSEIKRAQVDGLADYPVFTRKLHTDVSYLACARKLLAAPEAVYPQFATHNAHTLAAIHQAAGLNYYAGQYEFQCLHGMGEPLYERVVAPVADGGLGRPCRIYAPVGSHETLLAYLVRRLLENGANTSFVNRIADDAIPIEALVADPVQQVEQLAAAEGALGLPHPSIALPLAMFGSDRANSAGLDLSDELQLAALAQALHASVREDWLAAPIVGGTQRTRAAAMPVRNPADHERLRRQRARGGRRRCRRRAGRQRRRLARMAGHAAGAARRRAGARGRGAANADAATAGPARARSRQDGGQCGGRSARGRRLPALLRGPGAARTHARQPPQPRAHRVHQPVELPAGHLHRPGGGGAGRRQHRAGQAGRTDAADRRRRRCGCCTRPACRAARCNCCRAVARRSAPHWWPMRASAASCSPARRRSRASCNAVWPAGSTSRAAR